MKNLRFKYYLKLTLTFAMLVYSVFNMIRIGYFLDEHNVSGNTTPFCINEGSWILMFSAFFLFLLTIILYVNKKYKNTILDILFCILFCILLVFSFYIGVENTSYINEYPVKTNVTKSNFTNINLEDLKSITTNRKTEIVYIGRPTCPNCAKFNNELDIILKKNNKSILYYDTSNDRKTNVYKMNKILKQLSVDSVPIVIEFENGIIKNKCKGSDIKQQAENLLRVKI